VDKFLESVSKVTEMLEHSKHTAVITGPGIFDDISNGAAEDASYNNLSKMVSPEAFTIHRNHDDYGPFYEEGAPFFSLLYKAKPNAAHYALADLEKRGLVKTIITQNVDGLHQMAGSKNVLELHGTIRSATCEQCEYQARVEDLMVGSKVESLPLRCPDCGQLMKPDVVLQGDPPPSDYYEAKQVVLKADLIIIIGADMHDSSDNELIADKQNLVVINNGPTHFDQNAEIVNNEQPVKTVNLVLEMIKEHS
jgi:NAD-dependent deacetylase